MTPVRVAPRGSVVEASAGTGKTHRLVDEIAAAIESGIAVDRIVAVTFTHAAAGSMKIRVRQELERRRKDTTDPAERHRLKLALQTLDRAFIGTIHAFCAHLLHQRPVEACVDPDFGELDEAGARTLFAATFQAWTAQALATPSPALTRALARFAWAEDSASEGPLDKLEDAAWELAQWRDYETPWEIRPFAREDKLNNLFAAAAALAGLLASPRNPKDKLRACLRPVEETVSRRQTAEAIGANHLDDLETELLALPRQIRYFDDNKNGPPQYGETVARIAVVQAWLDLRGDIERFAREADADLAARLRPELATAVKAYQRAKHRTGQLDFQDLLIKARDLLRHTEARADLQARYDRLFVDEFQDTDALQAEILLLLSAADPSASDWRTAEPAPGKLFVVGDPKQSIYRFRRADARQYRRVRDHLTEQSGTPDYLTRNYRSTDALEQFVNAAFESMPEYLPLAGGAPASEAQPSVIALPMPYIHSGRYQSSKVLCAHAPNVVAAFIEFLVKGSHNWTVREGTERVPIRPDHICVLFRRMVSWGNDLAQDYVRALEARGIEHVLVGSKSFHKREEIGSIRTALRAIEWPDDELSVFGVLRGSLFFIPDSTLLKFHHKYRRFSPFVTPVDPEDSELEPVFEALGLIRRLHSKRNERPPAETIRELLEFTRAQVNFAFQHGGERRLANVYRLCDLARGFELQSPSSFRAFVQHLESEHESSAQSEAPVFEQRGGGVQLMTVHKAKGLDFPIVILADLTTRLTRQTGPDRYVDPDRNLSAIRLCNWAPWELLDHEQEECDEDLAEAERLAYVAGTRARDILVVSAVGKDPWTDSWLTPLYRALYPPKSEYGRPDSYEPMPVKGFRTVLDFPAEAEQAVSVRPGMHRTKAGARVFWFDPEQLDLKQPEQVGLNRSAMLKGSDEEAQQGFEEYQRWRARRASLVAAGSTPAQTVILASELRHTPPECANIPVVRDTVQWEGQRPSSRNFGKLVHAVLQSWNSDNPERIAEVCGRRWNSSEQEVRLAAEVARAAMQHPLLAASSATEVHHELPVSVTLSTGEIIEGIVDLAWSDGSSWRVVDYKTGKPEEKHEAQVRVYAFALQQATGLPATAHLLEI